MVEKRINRWEYGNKKWKIGKKKNRETEESGKMGTELLKRWKTCPRIIIERWIDGWQVWFDTVVSGLMQWFDIEAFYGGLV